MRELNEKTNTQSFWCKKGLLPLMVLSLLMLLIIVLADLGMLPVALFAGIPEYDRIAHALIYGAFYWALRAFLGTKGFHFASWSLTWSSLIAITLILLEEFTQLFFDTRTFDLIDIFCGFLGVLLVAHGYSLKNRRLRRTVASDEAAKNIDHQT
jgi:VanZ family protein